MTVAPDEFAALEQRATTDFPESWAPQKAGDILVGRFVRVDEASTHYGPCKIVVLEDRNGDERGVWLLHVVLKQEFRRARPKPGELVAVRFLGEKEGAGGQPYKRYRVVVQREEAGPDWDNLDARDQDVFDSEWGP
jgi:hypothetical protein